MSNHEDLQVRLMSAQDIGAAMDLKKSACWNQSSDDWQGFMRLEPSGCFVGEFNGKVVATATTINYQNRFGWIGMILVDPLFRRRGFATRMMEESIRYLESLPCPCQKLDATDAGAKVYEKIGFSIEYQVERWVHPGKVALHSEDEDITTLDEAFVDSIARWDAEVFGASRKRLLEWYLHLPSPSLLFGDPAQPQGFLMGRPGSGAFQIGPSAAVKEEVALRLMQRFLCLLPEQPLIADINALNPAARSLLESLGFQRHRILQRMYRGIQYFPGDPKRVFFLAGFEFG